LACVGDRKAERCRAGRDRAPQSARGCGTVLMIDRAGVGETAERCPTGMVLGRGAGNDLRRNINEPKSCGRTPSGPPANSFPRIYLALSSARSNCHHAPTLPFSCPLGTTAGLASFRIQTQIPAEAPMQHQLLLPEIPAAISSLEACVRQRRTI
jgi:hypothetical protein